MADQPSIRCEFRFVQAGKIEAFVDVHYGIFVMKDFKVIRNEDNELWVATPSRSYWDSDDKKRWTDTIYIPDLREKKAVQGTILAAYQEALRVEREEEAAPPVASTPTATVRADGSIALPQADDADEDAPF
jgi:DNA-binding cell septation regulator SpoVG